LSTDDPSSPAAISARWREAQRQLAKSKPGSPDSDRLAARVRDLAKEYSVAIKARDDETRPEPAEDPDEQPARCRAC